MPVPERRGAVRWRTTQRGARGGRRAPRPMRLRRAARRARAPRERCRHHGAGSDAGGRHAVDGAVPGDQGRQSGLPAVLPHGRLLRAVLRGRGGGRAGARHRAHQARQASGRGHPHVRRADPSRRRVPAAADPPGLPRRRVRAAGGPGGGEEARLQGGGAPRRGAPRHARHADRGQPARRQGAQLSDRPVRRPEGGAGERDDRAGLARHLHRRVRGGRGAGGRLPGRDRAPLAQRGDRRRPTAGRRAAVAKWIGIAGAAATPVAGASFDSLAGERLLKAQLGVADLAAFGALLARASWRPSARCSSTSS